MPSDLVLDGRFRIIRHLGGGGMSEVYLAEQISLGRQVALKVLKRDLGSQPEMAERFRREARILSSVDHPSVVRVIDFASAPEGMVLVLELAEGDTLENVLKWGALEPGRAVKLLLQLAEGLGAIHEKGIVHRDIKPQNVVVSQSPRGEQARLLDFGIARLMELPETGATESLKAHPNPFVSVPGQAVGTPAYVAPEQAMAQPVDTRTDVYSFGVLAFRTLAGRLPFEGPDTRDYLQQHVAQKAPSIEQFVKLDAFPGLASLVMECLEKSPNARPVNGQELAKRLQPFLPSSTSVSTQNLAALAKLGTQTWTAVQKTSLTFGKTSIVQMRRAALAAVALDSRWKKSLLIAGLVAIAIPASFALTPKTPAERVEALLASNKNAEALALVDSEIPQAKWQLPDLLSMRAAALHRLNRHAAEWSQLSTSPYQSLHPAKLVMLEALAEDFGANQNDARLREFLDLVPEVQRTKALRGFAAGPITDRQWGALRYLDITDNTKGLDLVERYSHALKSPSCAVRSTSAIRLAGLGDENAIEALRELSESAKDESPTGPVSCGQDEAAEAVRQLKHKAH